MTVVRALQFFLIAVDAGLIVAADRLMHRLGVPSRRLLLLAGIALSPVSILLSCQHGSFDSLVALMIVLFLLAMFRFLESGETAPWLAATFLLGCGTALKSIPAILAPLTAAGSRRLSIPERAIGAVLLFGPALYGLSIVFALGPAEVAEHVLRYRSLPGWFGLTGLLHWLGRDDLTRAWASVFPAVLATAMAFAGVAIWRSRSVSRRELTLWSLILLVGIPLLGSGYGPQYVAWFWPILFAAAPGASRRFQAAAGAFAAVAAATFLFEYGVMESLGGFPALERPERGRRPRRGDAPFQPGRHHRERAALPGVFGGLRWLPSETSSGCAAGRDRRYSSGFAGFSSGVSAFSGCSSVATFSELSPFSCPAAFSDLSAVADSPSGFCAVTGVSAFWESSTFSPVLGICRDFRLLRLLRWLRLVGFPRLALFARAAAPAACLFGGPFLSRPFHLPLLKDGLEPPRELGLFSGGPRAVVAAALERLRKALDPADPLRLGVRVAVPLCRSRPLS